MRHPWYDRASMYIVDTGLVILGYYLAFIIKFGLPIPEFNFAPFLKLIPWICALVMVIFWFAELYAGGRRQPREIIGASILSVAALTLATMAVAFFARGFSFPRSVFIYAAVIQTATLCGWRLLRQAVQFTGRGRSVVLIGQEFVGNEEIIGAVKAAYGREIRTETIDAADWEKVAGFLRRNLGVHQAVFLSATIPGALKKRLVFQCLSQNKEIYLVPEVYDLLMSNVRLNKLADCPVLQLGGFTLSAAQRMAKRAFDFVLSLSGLALSLPLLLPIAAAVALSSPGPVFYRQERVGLKGKRFTLIKFRSMVRDAEQMTGPILAAERDPRITAVGAFLRATHLDELPQLVNVLRGEMSFVGPRPERAFFVEQFSEEIPEYSYRHLVKPGLTGLAQVRGRYDTNSVNKLRFDLYYIRNYSLLLDLRIILQTVCLAILPENHREVQPQATKII